MFALFALIKRQKQLPKLDFIHFKLAENKKDNKTRKI